MLGEHSFSIGGPSLWNNLPDTVKEADIMEFKQILETHRFGQCTFRQLGYFRIPFHKYAHMPLADTVSDSFCRWLDGVFSLQL